MKAVVFLFLIYLITGCNTTKKNNTHAFKLAANPVVAHRGAWKKNNLPENSIAALQQAIHLKCAGTEFDVWMTADDSLVIHHDPEINKLEIEKALFKNIRANTLANNEPLPTLREYLQAGMRNNTTTRLVLEIKPSRINKQRGEYIAEKVMQLVHSLQAEKWMVFISFDYEVLKKINLLDSNAATQYLNGDKEPAVLKQQGIKGADYHYSVFKKNPDWIQQAKAYNLILNAWTVNETAEMQWLLNNGFDFITTNEPDLLLQLLSKKIK